MRDDYSTGSGCISGLHGVAVMEMEAQKFTGSMQLRSGAVNVNPCRVGEVSAWQAKKSCLEVARWCAYLLESEGRTWQVPCLWGSHGAVCAG